MGGDKLERLLMAAAKVIGEKGYALATIADIAEAAGIGKGTIYEYCSSKEQLLEMLMEHSLTEASREMGELDPAAPPLDSIHLLITAGLSVMDRMEATITLTIDFWSVAFKNKDSRIHAMLRSMYNEMVTLIASLVEAGQRGGSIRPECDGRSFAMILFSILDESFIHKTMNDRGFDREQFLRELLLLVDAHLAVR